MSKRDDFKKVVADDCGGPEAPQVRVFEVLVTKLAPGATDYISLPWLRQWMGPSLDDVDVFDVLAYFCGQRVPLLQSRYELIREDDSVEEVEGKAVFSALHGEPFTDPATGEVLHDWTKHVALSFRGTSLLQELVREPEV